ncbi:Ankyrin repeat and FYVE domain-containing protein 1 [Tritrichomonas musculus]|uniref:Ankyrin repeat and FYVE domain-containing protein 1 n=1 Tax=Tritrichomonas musculus TaxID=1915356 RepID=A0ABR2GQ67_9EUKA
MKTINFNELLPTGESFFTLIASQKSIDSDFINVNSSQTAEIASFLIDHGEDPNIPDKRGFYPLEYAILLESPSFVRVLLDSNKINLNQIIIIKDCSKRDCVSTF